MFDDKMNKKFLDTYKKMVAIGVIANIIFWASLLIILGTIVYFITH